MIYTVQKGETLSSIAQKVLGDKFRYKEIMTLNPEIKDPNKIYPNQKIKLPDSPYPSKTLQTNAVQNVQTSSNESGLIQRLRTIFMDKRVVLGLISVAGLYFIYRKKKK